jgi:glycyl-tRNA synthetase beta chain
MFEPPLMAAIHDIGGNAPAWVPLIAAHDPAISDDLLSFMHDRLKIYLRDRGARHDLIDSCLALPGKCDIALVVRRVEALGHFLDTEEGASLLALVRRALNILKIEEKKDGRTYDGKPAPKLMKNHEEKALAAAIRGARKQVDAALSREDFEAAMSALTQLRQPVDTFFERVTVNADDADMRANRLKLLGEIRALTKHIADFSKIEA